MNPDLENICLFAHHNSADRVNEYVYTYLSSLFDLQFNIIFISTSKINEAHTARLKQRIPGIKILIRENRGRDFGGWAQVICEGILPANIDLLLLTNDSVIGPFTNLSAIFESMAGKDYIDFWGLTDSYEHRWHIQSYFMCFSKKVHSSNAFRTVFKQNFNRKKRREIIEKGEIFLTTTLTDHGFKGEAYIPYLNLDKDTNSLFARNVTHFFWQVLINHYKFPFIKKDLILNNPENLENVSELFPFIRQVSGYNIESIKELVIANNEIGSKSTDRSKISVVCHIYYQHSIFYFLSKLSVLKKYNTTFFFNLAYTIGENQDIIDVLERSFPNAIIIHSPDKGRDIGGKFSLFDIMLKTGADADYTLVIHDKFSPHTPTGTEWRNKLFKIIDEKEIPDIINQFNRNKQIGIIGTKDLIRNEYNPDKNAFDCTSSAILIRELNKYKLNPDNYNFIAGTVFWIRNEILKTFFLKNSPLVIRKTFEEGNALDFVNGTVIHSWERLFSMLVTSEHYKLKGI